MLSATYLTGMDATVHDSTRVVKINLTAMFVETIAIQVRYECSGNLSKASALR